MLKNNDEYMPKIVEILRYVPKQILRSEVQYVNISGLHHQMIFLDDVKSKKDTIIISKGNQVTYEVIKLLRQFSMGVGIKEPIKVQVFV